MRRLNGMFALALFDEHRNQLFMGRDRAGIKPLYYAYDGAALCFASAASALIASSSFP